MTTSWLVTNFIAAFFLPPANFLLLAVLGAYLARRRKRLGRSLIVVAFAGIWVSSLPLVSDRLLDSLNAPYIPLTADQAEAIVVLGGGSDKDVLEYGGDTVTSSSLERVRYGAYLARKLKKPVLITGGNPAGGNRSEADIMAEVMTREFSVPVKWIEDRSNTTYDNARLSAPILGRDGIRRIYLVSHAWHLSRAIPQFERAGLTVIPAGIGYMPEGRFKLGQLVPNALSLKDTYHAVHEWIGLLWYRFRNLME